MLNVDTHVLLHAVTGQLRPAELRLLQNDTWSISAIVLWELAKLAQLGRIELNLDSPELGRVLARIHVWPIDLAVCRRLASLDFRSDPADELIAATSIVHNVALVTRDRLIRASRLTPLAA